MESTGVTIAESAMSTSSLRIHRLALRVSESAAILRAVASFHILSFLLDHRAAATWLSRLWPDQNHGPLDSTAVNASQSCKGRRDVRWCALDVIAARAHSSTEKITGHACRSCYGEP